MWAKFRKTGRRKFHVFFRARSWRGVVKNKRFAPIEALVHDKRDRVGDAQTKCQMPRIWRLRARLARGARRARYRPRGSAADAVSCKKSSPNSNATFSRRKSLTTRNLGKKDID